MKLGVQAGRLAYLAGRMEKNIMPAQVHPRINYFKIRFYLIFRIVYPYFEQSYTYSKIDHSYDLQI
jgi:hypothetical protein